MSVAEWTGRPARRRSWGACRRADAAYGVLVSGQDDEAQAARSSVVGASWILPLAALPAPWRVPRHQHERRAALARPRRSGAPGGAGLVRLRVDEVGARDRARRPRRTRHVADGGVRRPHAPGRTPAAGARLRATGHRSGRHAHPRGTPPREQHPPPPHGRHRVGRHAARSIAGDPLRLARRAGSRSTSAPPPTSTRRGRCGAYRWMPTEPGVYNIAHQKTPTRRSARDGWTCSSTRAASGSTRSRNERRGHEGHTKDAKPRHQAPGSSGPPWSLFPRPPRGLSRKAVRASFSSGRLGSAFRQFCRSCS